MSAFDLVVVSHLRWSFVWQRPQQLLSRLARYHRILFIEEPVFAQDIKTAPALIMDQAMSNLYTLTPQVPRDRCGDVPLWLWPCPELISRQVQDVLRALEFQQCVLWLYTPTPEFLVESVQPAMLVYDVMDELANFKFAPPQLREREQRLLKASAVVFTGGASLYDAKKGFNPNTHLFASGVDEAHYAKACLPETTIPDWMQAIPGPRATYIGVIDERLDYEIVAKMAQERPEVQFVMCGPIVKVDPADLPEAPNLHYPGQQSYEDLPRILKGSDITLMPFARNDATKFISPTKTLEYMATHRPIVSTPIRDVERFYSDIVFLAGTPDDFVAQIDAALNEPTEVRERKRLREEKILTEQAWDAIVDNMESLMLQEWARTPIGKAQDLEQRLAGLPSEVTGAVFVLPQIPGSTIKLRRE
jgi:UDP-galactopyranose mutase